MALDGILPQFLPPWSDDGRLEGGKGGQNVLAQTLGYLREGTWTSDYGPLSSSRREKSFPWSSLMKIQLDIFTPDDRRKREQKIRVPSLDLLSATLRDVAIALEKGLITSERLVLEYLDRIERDNHQGLNLCAVIEAAPRAIVTERARELDLERRLGICRGPLHGIPIIVKDSIYTDRSLGMETTAGVHAFVGFMTPGNAPVIENLLRAGAIIIGKANLTVLNSMYGSGLTHGWSPRGGQTLSPYTLEPSPHGSSSGSAAALAAGQCAASVGSETCGSIIDPGTRAGLYSFKPSFGVVPGDRVISISFRQDVLGPFGKCSWDVAAMLSGMVTCPHDYTSYVSASQTDLARFKLGIWAQKPACPTVHVTESAEEVLDRFEDAMRRIKLAFPETIVDEVVAIDPPRETRDIPEEQGFRDGVWHGRYINQLLSTDLHEAINTHLANLQDCNLKDIDDLIRWNDQHPELAFPNGGPQTADSQRYLRWARDSRGRKDAAYDIALEWLTSAGKSVEAYMSERGLDALLLPAWSKDAALLSASIGFPMASVPLGTVENGNPTAVWIIAKPGADKDLLSIMAGCERLFPSRPLPQPLIARYQKV